MYLIKLTKNALLFSVTFFLCFWAAKNSYTQQNDRKSPNILFIAVDDLNDWVGTLEGYPNIKTPNIDSLGESGIVFTNAHTQAPLCGPSRASLMTGLYPSTTGIYLHIDDREVREANKATRRATFLPEYFDEQGYKTMGAGKIWHGNDLGNTFQEYGERHEWFGPRPQERINYDPEKGPNYDGQGGTSTDWGAYPKNDEEVSDYYYSSWVIEKLKQDHDQPFFLAVGFVRPHVPWYVPQHWLDMYPLENIQLPPYLEDDLEDIPEVGQHMAFMPPMPTRDYLEEKGQWKEMIQAYLASITFTDHQVGRVIRALEESSYADNTIIVLFSDHGYHLGEKNRVAKMSLWERDTRVPLIFSGPGIDSNLRSSRPVGLIDIYPTLLDLGNLPENHQNEGRSLTPLIKDVDREWPYPVVTSFGPGNISLRSDHFRYIQYEDGSEEFYDHRNDPYEWYNLAKDAKLKTKVNSEIEKLQQFIPEGQAPLAKESSFDMNSYFRERMEEWRQGQ